VIVSDATVTPVPASVAVPVVAADAVTLMLADFATALVGLNATCTVHCALGASVAPVHKSLDLVKLAASVPVRLKVMAVLAVWPVFLTVKVVALLVVFTVWERKSYDDGEIEKLAGVSAVNVAVTPFVGEPSGSEQVPTPLQPAGPDQPVKLWVPSATAVRTIGVDE
jgi:hypothetical protein